MLYSTPQASPVPQTTFRRDAQAPYVLQQSSDFPLIRPVHPEPIAWWFWWNVLSLDAPAVACLWAILFLRCSEIHPPLTILSALAIAVWLIYTFDRLLDSHPSRRHKVLLLQKRHFFCARHRLAFTAIAVAASVVLFFLCKEYLPPTALRAGQLLGAIVALYLCFIHSGAGGTSGLMPKEIAVGLIFAAGTSVPLWSLGERISLHSAMVTLLFGLLCSLNCLAIECWESSSQKNSRLKPTRWISWADLHLNQLAVFVAIAAQLAGFLPGSRELPLLAISVAAILVLLLNISRKSLSRESLRVLVDAALVLPALLALFY
jgi:hypothetical protein